MKKKTRKIIFIHLLNDFSGSPKVLSQVIKVVHSKKIDLELYTGNRTPGFLSNITKNHHFFIYRRYENRYLTLISFLFSQIVLFFKLLKYWRKDVDIYINTMLPFGAGLAGWVMRKPVIYHIHETYISPQNLKSFLRKIIQLTSKKIVFVSESVKTLESFENKSQLVVYNALPSNFTKTALKQAYSPFHACEFNLLMISSMKAYKGVFEFIELARKMQSNEVLRFKLVLNAAQAEIDRFFEKIVLPANVFLFPQQKDVIPFYSNASIVLNLSRIDQCIETFGLTILEALSFGIPVIVPPIGGPTEIVTDGKEGFLISSYDIEAIAQKIDYLSKNSEKCLELSHNAKLRSQDFNEENFNKSITHFLNV